MKILQSKLQSHKTRALRYPLNWLMLLAGCLLALAGCGSGNVDTRCKRFVEFGDSTTNQRGGLVGDLLPACSVYDNRGHDGQTTAQALVGLYGDNFNSGVIFEDAMNRLIAENALRVKEGQQEHRIIVGFNLGINDEIQEVPVDAVVANISRMAALAENRGFEALVILPNRLQFRDMSVLADKLRRLGYPTADAFSVPVNLPDSIHPDEAGRNAIAKVIADAVKAL